jgi:ubiquinol-cytochrome c reductase cytochrome c subunit
VGRAVPLVLCLAVVAVVSLGHGGTVAARSGPETGERLYGRECAWCHGPSGEGTSRGVPLTDSGAAAAHYYLSTGRMPIDDPGAEVERGAPAYSDAAIAALVDHVAGFGDGPPIPDVSADGDVALGGSLYRLHCAQCHGASGVGIALTAGVTAPSIHSSTPTQVAEALVVGPGAMPTFRPTVLSETEAAGVVRYVQEIRRPVDRGGHPLARSGRLDELLVAWGIGVVAFVGAARMIARRR